ncbi:MAG: hypothetical protein ACRD1T_25135, partial [Acidimicrobiia bacterium]
AATQEIDVAQIDRVLAQVYAALLESPCFLNRLTEQWCYDFGLPLERLANNSIALGAPMFPSVARLLDVLLFAERRLAPESRSTYLRRLADESRHQDVVAEMLVVLDVPGEARLAFETPAETGNGRTIDWRLRLAPFPPLLFDVKNRMGDAVAFLSNLITAGPQAGSIEPTHDPALLFEGVLSKFVAHSPAEYLQGIWVITKVKQEETELQAAFRNLDARRIHFAVISNMSRECQLLSQPEVDRSVLVRALNLSERPDRIVFRRGG